MEWFFTRNVELKRCWSVRSAPLVRPRERCRQHNSHVTFSHVVNTHWLLHITLHGSRMCWCASHVIYMVIHVVRLSALWLSVPHFVPFRVFLLSLPLLLDPWAEPLPPCGRRRGKKNTGTPPNEESGPLAENAPLTGYEPNFFDDFHYSETTEIFLKEQSSDTAPSCLTDTEVDDETIGRALSSPLFTQEREEPADRRQAYHSFEESLLPAQSLSVCHARTGRPVHELSSLGSSTREKPSRDSENERIRILLERQKRANSRWF